MTFESIKSESACADEIDCGIELLEDQEDILSENQIPSLSNFCEDELNEQ